MPLSTNSNGIGASNFSSDQGSVDSCHYSSNGSDSNSGSSPCSPEEPDRFSRSGTPQPMPPIPPALQEDCQSDDYPLEHHSTTIKKDTKHSLSSSNTDDFSDEKGRTFFHQKTCPDRTKTVSEPVTKPEGIKHFYLPQSSSVPKSHCESFQRAETQNIVPSFKQTADASCSSSECKTAESSETSGHSESIFHFDKRNNSQINSCSSISQSNCSSTEFQQCSWLHCKTCVEGNAELVEHIRSDHVQPQMDKESFVCLWTGCKVYNRTSCSLSWLERHILCHGGNKPFKCIVDNCSQRFPTQAALQRHVNSHFDQNGSHGNKSNKCRDEMASKNFRRKKHLKYKKRSASSATEDFFDTNIMEQIKFKLVESNISSQSMSCPGFVIFHSRVKAKRFEKSGKVLVLLEWIPQNVLPDSWESESSAIKYKKIPYSSLPPESLAFLTSSTSSCNTPPVKRRRK
ncbi:zinc finger protein aebp2-like [Uloborus diversus]|uniref:zinc finger protein aebp2-like n=1 Tax=Uloborus diversus TaxID=327109 RepID=UPI00240A6A77|nr:zinc finger protein aebp2-like [Uloborus diversus]